MFQHSKTSQFKRMICGWLTLVFVWTSVIPPAYAQGLLNGGQSTSGVIQPGGSAPAYAPALLKGLKVNPQNPLRFDFILDTGSSVFDETHLRDETTRMIKYFLASLTIPEDDLWVNLSPKDSGRIVPNSFGVTEMGKDLLEADLQLKKLAASLLIQKNEERSTKQEVVSEKEKAGSMKWLEGSKREEFAQSNKNDLENISIPSSPASSTSSFFPLPTSDLLSRIWIVPGTAEVFESDKGAFVVKSHLRVMFQEDLNADGRSKREDGGGNENASGFTLHSSYVKNEFLSTIETAVNTAPQFTKLRQIYNALILAAWYKYHLKEGILNKVYVGKNKVDGISAQDKEFKEKIYQQYLKSFQDGIEDFVKEEYDPTTQEVVARRYFSGGAKFGHEVDAAMVVDGSDEKKVVGTFTGNAVVAGVDLDVTVPEEPLEFENDAAEGQFRFAKEYADSNPAIQAAPKFETFETFYSWYNQQTTSDLPNVQKLGAKISASYTVQILGSIGKIPEKNIQNFQRMAGASEYGAKSETIKNAPTFSTINDFQVWYQTQTPETLPNGQRKGEKLGPGNAVLVLGVAKKIVGNVDNLKINVSAYEYAQSNNVIKRAPRFSDFEKLLKWYKSKTADDLPYLKDKSQKIGLSYTIQALGFAGKIIGSVESFQRMANAYKYSEINTVIKSAPIFETFESFIVWYNERSADDLPNTNQPGAKIGASYAIQVLGFAEKIMGSVVQFHRKASAYEYAINNEVIKGAPVFEKFVDFMKWFKTLTATDLPNEYEAGKKISASYTVTALAVIGKIRGNLEEFQRKSGAFERAEKDSEIIKSEIKRIWGEKIGIGKVKQQTSLSRLNREFDRSRLPNKSNPKKLLSPGYLKEILNFAYLLYGKDLIEDLSKVDSALLGNTVLQAQAHEINARVDLFLRNNPGIRFENISSTQVESILNYFYFVPKSETALNQLTSKARLSTVLLQFLPDDGSSTKAKVLILIARVIDGYVNGNAQGFSLPAELSVWSENFDYLSFGQRVKGLRLLNKKKLLAIQHRSGISGRTLLDIEKGSQSKIKLMTIIRLAHYYKISIDELITGQKSNLPFVPYAVMDEPDLLGANLIQVLKERNMSQTEFASKLDLDEGFLSELINGKYFPNIELFFKMIKVLNVSIDRLLRKNVLLEFKVVDVPEATQFRFMPDQPDLEAMGLRIRALRVEAGETQQQAGDAMGIEKFNLFEVETGKNKDIRLSTLIKYANHFNVPLFYLITGATSFSAIAPHYTEEALRRNFGRVLKAKRLAKGLNPKDIYGPMGVSSALYSQWERGRVLPQLNNFVGIVRLTQSSVDEFFVEPVGGETDDLSEPAITETLDSSSDKAMTVRQDLDDYRWSTENISTLIKFHMARKKHSVATTVGKIVLRPRIETNYLTTMIDGKEEMVLIGKVFLDPTNDNYMIPKPALVFILLNGVVVRWGLDTKNLQIVRKNDGEILVRGIDGLGLSRFILHSFALALPLGVEVRTNVENEKTRSQLFEMCSLGSNGQVIFNEDGRTIVFKDPSEVAKDEISFDEVYAKTLNGHLLIRKEFGFTNYRLQWEDKTQEAALRALIENPVIDGNEVKMVNVFRISALKNIPTILSKEYVSSRGKRVVMSSQDGAITTLREENKQDVGGIDLKMHNIPLDVKKANNIQPTISKNLLLPPELRTGQFAGLTSRILQMKIMPPDQVLKFMEK